MAGSWVGAEDWDQGGGQDPMPRGRRIITVVCCPSCESFDDLSRWHEAGSAIARWECGRCKTRWKEPADTGGAGRAWPI